MPVPVDKGARTDEQHEQAEWKDRLVDYVMARVEMSDREEELRRKSDRIGANLYYGRHYNVAINPRQVAITANVTKALIEHKIAIMTKQEPIPVIVAGDAGDARSARLMRQVIQRWWVQDGMQMKIRRAERLANSTRTCALKAVWDPSRMGGAGDITVDIIPGWRLILDPRANFLDDMEFVGHREMIRRSHAAQLYPESAGLILAKPEERRQDARRGRPVSSSQLPPSPIQSGFKTGFGGSLNFGTVVNGKPVISAFSNQPGGAIDPDEGMVQMIELLYKDDTMYEDEETVYDEHGNPRQEIARDEAGMPLFDEIEAEHHTADGISFTLPAFKLRMNTVKRPAMKRLYPFYRRTTIMLPDRLVVDDIPWDGPANYALVSDGDTLEGPWVRGCGLDLEDMQVSLNVSLSLMMGNLRLSAMRPVLAGQGANLNPGTTLLLNPGQVVPVGNPDQIKPFEFPQLAESWFNWANFLISLMERIVGAQGIMQGEAAGRVDSAAGYDTLAEIGGSRLVESTQRMEVAIEDIMGVVGWFAQKYYTERHAVAVADEQGNPTYERVTGAFLYGTFDYQVRTGSTLAWSETAVRNRLLQELKDGIIDKVAYWQRTNEPDWQEIRDRLLQQNPILSGPAAAPPPRTRSTPNKLTPGKGK